MRVATFALLALVLVAIAACGGSDSLPDPTREPDALTASDLLPDLRSDGFTLEDGGPVPGSTTDQDAQFAIYFGDGAVRAIRLEVNMQQTPIAAKELYATLSQALRNPPADLFGPNASQRDNTPVFTADESKSYVTAQPDDQGGLVYSDAHLFGRAIVIVYVIANNPEDAAEIREQLARWIDDKAR